ncbi:plasmolipin [Cyprinodon tularosa]|uniref:plasmolipin n=1 Tax=Cyprinodon tularosa TaxID=77115 RepID=UPI0018E27339|nr:plasmolipin [Cyprinodon tularosa]
MADFPSKVTTETSTPNYQNTHQGGNRLSGMTARVTTKMDVSFVRSIQGILMITEIVVGLFPWALIASTPYMPHAAYGWVMFVEVTLWLLTIILFFVLLFSVPQRLTVVPWALTVMMYTGVATLLYLTAFITNAATANVFKGSYFFGHIGAAAFFGAALTLLYGASAYLAYLDWRGDGGNAATSTVPT